MKKFMTVLLVIAVMFTFSFGSAFAATNYTAADYATTLSAEMSNQLSYLANAKAQALNAITYDEDGFYAGYSKEAYTAAADKVIEEATALMEQAVRDAADAVPAGGTTTAPDKTVVTSITTTLLSGSGMKTAMDAQVDVMDKAQEPVTKAFYEGKLNAVDASKYANTGDHTYGSVTGLSDAEYVEILVAEALKAIADAAGDTTLTAAAKIAEYTSAYGTFKTAFGTVDTAEDKDLADKETAKDVAGAVNTYLAEGAVKYNAYKLQDTNDDDIYEVDPALKVAPFYTEKTSKAKATLFGVEIDNIDRVTKAEALAVNEAFYNAIQESADVVKKACDTAAEVNTLTASFMNTLGNAMKVAEVYADVVEYGAALKGEYSYGVKQYNDAAVDKVVAKAESLVYADLGDTLKDAEDYFDDALTALDMVNADIEEVNYEYQKLMAAIEEAKDKFQDATVNYGADKTAAEDVQFCKNQYASSEYTDYATIKADAIEALDAAECYADIDAALADASAELAKLMKAADATAVATAKAKYAPALTQYAASVEALLTPADYDGNGQVAAALSAGQTLINDAVTVDGVVAAFEEAKTLFNNLKTDDEIDALKTAVVKKINALPYLSGMTVADKAAVEDVYAAYAEYKAVYGAPEVSNKAVLTAAVDKIADLEAEELNEKIDDLEKALAKVATNSDADITAYVAMKGDVEALVAEAKAFNKDIVAKEKVLGDITTAYADADALAALLGAENAFWDKEVAAVEIALVAATKDGASVETMKAALDAYKALTDRQTYAVDYSVLKMADLVEAGLASEVEALKITAGSTAKKGSITVKWTVKGNAEAVDGYQVWKSTKKNSGYKKAFTTEKTSYKNTKGLKKGTRYFYKVRAYVVVDGKNVYSDWSNKAYRIAK